MLTLILLLVLVGLLLMTLAHLPNTRVPTWLPWAFWTVAFLLWALPKLTVGG